MVLIHYEEALYQVYAPLPYHTFNLYCDGCDLAKSARVFLSCCWPFFAMDTMHQAGLSARTAIFGDHRLTVSS